MESPLEARMPKGPYVPRGDGSRVVDHTSVVLDHTTVPLPHDYASSHGGVRLISSPPRGPIYKGGGVAAVLASDEKYPLMPAPAPNKTSYSQPSSQASGGGSPLLSRTRAGVGLPRYGSPTFPPPTERSTVLAVATSGVSNVPGAVRRPVSFVRALEMADQLGGSAPGAVAGGRSRTQQRVGVLHTTAEEDDRTYGSSYEIAV